MDKVCETLQVLFEEPFWIGVFEKRQEGKLSVCKVTFGAEPKDYEVENFVLSNYYNLRFGPTVEFKMKEKEKVNPKRRQREVKKQLKNAAIGTKSQQAIKLGQEEVKLDRKIASKKRYEEEKAFQFALKQQKKKKHKGRLSSPYWYEERTDFSENAIGTSRVLHEEVRGFDVIQGQGVVRGKLLGGCLESLYDILSNTRYLVLSS